MRILMAVPKYPFPVAGGLERQSHELAKSLVRRGHVVHVLSSRFHSEQKNLELVDGVLVHRVPWVESRLLRYLQFPLSLGRILFQIRNNIDLVHVHNLSWFGAFVTFFAKCLCLPVITKLAGIGDSGILGVSKSKFGFLRVALFKLSDAIVAMTPDSLEELAGIGYPFAQTLKVTNGISLLKLKPRVPSLLSSKVTAVFVGRLVPTKGAVDLIYAWKTVKTKAASPVLLRIIGDGPQEDELKVLVKALDLNDSVEFCGYCMDVPNAMANCDLFVLPSHGEGNSNAILEAMCIGLPVVSTRVGGTPIQVGSEGEHFLISVGDRDALADRLIELIKDKSLRIRIGEAMQARIESIFSIDKVSAIYEQAYELILSGQPEKVGLINPHLFNIILMETISYSKMAATKSFNSKVESFNDSLDS